ncbi:cadherin domain-containing protein [Rhizobium sp. YIM 134829]|uniref:cadherin domain-containing protein n=1 Tax=Rhizobium sp. YIM 134829 TaxID=3390453 RepID=UPI003979C717
MATEVYGTAGNDTISATFGDQIVFAGSGKDTVIFSSHKSDYAFSAVYSSGAGATVTIQDLRLGSPDGSDKLYNVEVLQFVDGVVDFTNTSPSFLSLSASRISEFATAGTVIGRVSAIDFEGNPVTYSLVDDANGTVRLEGDQLILLKPLDYESAASFRFSFKATDDLGASSTSSITVWVDDERENRAPTNISIDTLSIAESTRTGSVVAHLSAFDADGDSITFSIKDDLGALFSVEGNELELATAVDFESARKTSFTIVATDQNGATTEQRITLAVTDAEEVIRGTSKANDIIGGDGADRIFGRGGSDRLHGQDGNDTIIGGLGGDKLFGDDGADVFAYTSAKESTVARAGQDEIFDFVGKRDRVDLTKIDANLKAVGNQAFKFIGDGDFHGKAGELRYERTPYDTIVSADLNGDKVADFAIKFDDPIFFKSSYFFL